MDEHTLGPNGGLIYCMEYLELNIEWLQDKLDKCCKGVCHIVCHEHPVARLTIYGQSADKYVLFDCPGQIELYTHHHSMRNICERLQDQWDYRVRYNTRLRDGARWGITRREGFRWVGQRIASPTVEPGCSRIVRERDSYPRRGLARLWGGRRVGCQGGGGNPR
jgi:GTPase SAR1 family protein